MSTPLHNALIELQAEFEAHHLEVVLVPCRREVNVGGMVRVAVNKNATWYRRFCARHCSSRTRKNLAVDTKIRRRDVAILLGHLIAGRKTRSKYAPEILAAAVSRARLAPCDVELRRAS